MKDVNWVALGIFVLLFGCITWLGFAAARWRKGDKDLNALEAVYRKYSYVARWRQQLEEREIALLTGD